MRYGHDVIKCPICGARMVNRQCPQCGAMHGAVREKDHSRFGRYEPLLRGLNCLLVLLCAAALAGCVVTRVLNDRADYRYEVVRATVTDVSQDTGPFSGYHSAVRVTMLYDGTEYRLKNVTQGSWYYPVGGAVEAYLSNGALYANEAGVRSAGPMAMAYFVCLFGFMGLLFLTVTLHFVRREIRMQVI